MYSIDYKFLATTSSLQAKRETSRRITKISDGCIAFGIGRLPAGKQFEYVRTVAALRKYSVDDFERIAAHDNDNIEKNVSTILKNLRTKKNVLFFYPYILSFSVKHEFVDGCKQIEAVFNEDLNQIRLYREHKAPGYDTFICTIYENKLLIFQDNGNEWHFEDYVELMDSRIFNFLYYTYGNSGFLYK